MPFRTFHIHGKADDSAGTVTVDGVVVHSGIFKDGILFTYSTDSTLHGKVVVMVSMTYGSITIDSVNVTYPAVIGGMTGFVEFPQPITQPFQPHMLPLPIEGDMEFPHYMHNGPAQFIVDGSPQRYVYIESFVDAFKAGSIKPDWQYKNRRIGIDNINDLSRLRRVGQSFPHKITRRLREFIDK